MSPYRLFPRPPTTPDAFANIPKHPRITIYPATTVAPRRYDYASAFIWGCVAAFAILLIDAIVRT